MLKKNARRQFAAAYRSRGFNLIELMISIVIGLLIVAGGTSVIIAINASNAATIESARLTQELRTTLEVVAGDLRRPRRLDDPFGAIGQAALAKANSATYTGPYDAIASSQLNTSSSGPDCISYGYAGTENNSATDTTRATADYRVIRRAVVSGVGSVVLLSNTDPTKATCDVAGGTRLSSNQIDITDLTFRPASPATTIDQGLVMVTLSGKLRSNGAGRNLPVTRTVSQIVNVRSTKAGG